MENDPRFGSPGSLQ